MTNHLNFFGDSLADLLSATGTTVKELSAKTGIGLSRIYDFLSKKHIPSLENAIKIADYFECSLDFLFGFVTDYKPRTYSLRGTVCEQVKNAIDRSGMSRYQIHKRTNIDESQLLRWYSGKQTPSLVSLIALADALGISLDTLAGRE